MQVGDVINLEQVKALPDESVVRGMPDSGDDGCVAVRRGGKWAFISRGVKPGQSFNHFAAGGGWVSTLYDRGYELLYLPPVPAPKVGDVLTGRQLDGLPVGSVVVGDEDADGEFNTVTRTFDGFYWVDGVGRSTSATHVFTGDISVGGWTLVHIADTGAVRTAA